MVCGHMMNEYSVESWELVKTWSIVCFGFFWFFLFSLLEGKIGNEEEGGAGESQLNTNTGTLKKLYSFIDVSNLNFWNKFWN